MPISPSNSNDGHASPSTVPAELLPRDPPRFSEDVDSNCSTPFVSAPSSPAHEPPGYFFSAPASPMHFLLLTEGTKTLSSEYEPVYRSSNSGTFEFEFSSRFSPDGSMTSADELFFNGQIRVHGSPLRRFFGRNGRSGTGTAGMERKCSLRRRKSAGTPLYCAFAGFCGRNGRNGTLHSVLVHDL